MQLKKLCRGLLTLGISCSLMFQTPVFAAEETTTDTQTDASAVTTNSIPGWPQGPEITGLLGLLHSSLEDLKKIHGIGDHGGRHTDSSLF